MDRERAWVMSPSMAIETVLLTTLSMELSTLSFPTHERALGLGKNARDESRIRKYRLVFEASGCTSRCGPHRPV